MSNQHIKSLQAAACRAYYFARFARVHESAATALRVQRLAAKRSLQIRQLLGIEP